MGNGQFFLIDYCKAIIAFSISGIFFENEKCCSNSPFIHEYCVSLHFEKEL